MELISFEEAPSTYSMSAAEKKVRPSPCRRSCRAACAQAALTPQPLQAYSEKIKESGNVYFKTGSFRRALRRYEVRPRDSPPGWNFRIWVVLSALVVMVWYGPAGGAGAV